MDSNSDLITGKYNGFTISSELKRLCDVLLLVVARARYPTWLNVYLEQVYINCSDQLH